MPPLARKCSPALARLAAKGPTVFPFLPNACPSKTAVANAQIGTLLSFLFSIACNGPELSGMARVTPQSCPLASAPIYEQTTRQNPRVKSVATACGIGPLLIPENFHRQEPRGSTGGKNSRPDRDSHRCEG